MDYRDTPTLVRGAVVTDWRPDPFDDALDDTEFAAQVETRPLDVVQRFHDDCHPDPWVLCRDALCDRAQDGCTDVDAAVQEWHDRRHPDGWSVCLEQPCHAVRTLNGVRDALLAGVHYVDTFTGVRS